MVIDITSFKEQANQVHGTKYSYSKAVYTASRSKLTITCPIHGDFEQTANSHLQGNGCMQCAVEERAVNKTKTIEEFIQKAVKLHNNKYSYEKTVYTKGHSKAIITCPIHGDFEQTLVDHLSGRGCNKCGIEARSKKQTMCVDEFITRSNIKHNNKFDYSKVVYTKAKKKVVIICPEHGEFEQSPDTHLRSVDGCIKCGHVATAANSRSSTEKFIEKAIKLYGTAYDYSVTKYTTAIAPIDVLCNNCSKVFTTTANKHLCGSGCTYCCNGGGFDNSKPGVLYYLSINNGEAYKIGITNKSVQQRFRAADLEKIKVVKTWDFALGLDARKAERYYLQTYKDKKYNGIPLLTTGNTELFYEDVLDLASERAVSAI